MSVAITTKGTQLQIDNGSGVYTTIAEVTNISGPTEVTAQLDATNFDSTSKEYISTGLADTNNMTVNCHWITGNAQHQQLRTDLRAGTKRNFKILLTDSTTIAFNALILELGMEMPAGGIITQSVSLKPTQAATWTYGP